MSASHYAHAELLHDAPSFGQPQDDLLADLDGTLGLQYPGNYFENSGGLGEKWIISDSGQWYFITPVGDIYEWVAGQSMGDGAILAQLDSSVHASPDTLHDASASNLTLPELAYQLDQDLGLEFSSSYFEDWAGWSEKWIQSQSGNWHFITPDGSFYRFTTQASLASNILIATFDSTYHSDPSALHDAPTPSAMQLVFDETGDGQLSTSVYSNAWLATEDSSTLRDTSVNTFHVDIQSLAQDVIATEQHLSELAFSALANGQTANDFGALTSDENALEDATEGSFIDRIAGEIDESAIDQLFGRLVAWS